MLKASQELSHGLSDIATHENSDRSQIHSLIHFLLLNLDGALFVFFTRNLCTFTHVHFLVFTLKIFVIIS